MNNFSHRLNFIFALIFSIFLFGEAFLISVYNIDILNYIVVLFLLISLFFFKKINYTVKTNIRILITAIFLLIISSLFWSSFYNVSSYVSIIIAFFAHSFFRESFKKIFVLLLIFNLFLSFYEYFTSSYIFDSKLFDDFTSNETTIDRKFSGGLIQVFRAKGMFYGPLSLGAFAISVSFLNHKNFIYIFSSLMICFFANHRLGFLILSVLLLLNLFKTNKVKLSNFIYFILSISIFLFFIGVSENFLITVERLSNTLNVSSSENIERINFWIAALNQFINYDLANLLIGDNGYFKIIYGNNPESGWLSLLVDNGIFGFFLYLLSIFYISIQSLRKQSIDIFVLTILIFLCMSLFTFHLSAVSSLMYWFVIFELITFLDKKTISL